MNLKKIRLEKNWSQEQLADISGVSARTIQRIENGKSPATETLKALAAGLEMSLDELEKPASEDIEVVAKKGVFSHIPIDWKDFIIHLAIFMMVITWLLGLTLLFNIDKEIAGSVGAIWGLILVIHLVKVVIRVTRRK